MSWRRVKRAYQVRPKRLERSYDALTDKHARTHYKSCTASFRHAYKLKRKWWPGHLGTPNARACLRRGDRHGQHLSVLLTRWRKL